MTPSKIRKLRRELDSLRRSTATASVLESLAKRLGRQRIDRGKEPVWESAEFPDLFPLSIPHHGGRDLAIGTQRSILNQLEDDMAAWEDKLGV